MSFPEASESGDPPPPRGSWSPQDSGTIRRSCQSAAGRGLAIACLACGALIVPSMIVMMFPAALVSWFTRPDIGRSGREWVASTVFFGPPVLLTLFALLFGILALRRTHRGTNEYRTGIAGLIVTVVVAVFVLVPSLQRGY